MGSWSSSSPSKDSLISCQPSAFQSARATYPKIILLQPAPPTFKFKRFLCCKNMGVLRIPWIFPSAEVTLKLHPPPHKVSDSHSTPPVLIFLHCQTLSACIPPLLFSSSSPRPRSFLCCPQKDREKRTFHPALE